MFKVLSMMELVSRSVTENDGSSKTEKQHTGERTVLPCSELSGEDGSIQCAGNLKSVGP